MKNPVELDGLKKAHICDGAVVVNYLAWLDREMQEIYGAAGYFSKVKEGVNQMQALPYSSPSH